jgi:hypothetical protein
MIDDKSECIVLKYLNAFDVVIEFSCSSYASLEKQINI